MKKLLVIIFAAVMACFSLSAQSKSATLNSNGDNILGTYYVVMDGEDSKVKVSKSSDGTYTATVIWVKNDKEKDGSKRLDTKNPDKSLRTVPCDKIVLIKGLKYDSSSKTWGDTKVYDPTRGIKANVKVKFGDDGRLSVKGSLMGISETIYWDKLQ